MVRLESGKHTFETVTVSYYDSSELHPVLLDDQPWLGGGGGCIGKTGVESLAFNKGDTITLTAWALDYAGLRSDPVQTSFTWPVEHRDPPAPPVPEPPSTTQSFQGCSVVPGAQGAPMPMHSGGVWVWWLVLAVGATKLKWKRAQ